MKNLTYCATILVILTFSRGSNDSVGPPLEPKDPREFVWTVDTLRYPGASQIRMRRMHVVNSSDIYVVGHSDLAVGSVFHWNGKVWEAIDFINLVSPYIGIVAAEDVFGFGTHDIWIVGEHSHRNPNPPPNYLDSSFAVHFDGTTWREYTVPRARGLLSVWGAAPDDVWAGGTNVLLHFDGTAWTQVAVPLPEGETQLVRISGLSSSDIFMSASAFDTRGPGSTAYFTYHYDGHVLTIVDSAFNSGEFQIARSLKGIGNSMYGGGRGVYRWAGDSWQRLVESDPPIVGLGGPAEDYIFAVGASSTILHSSAGLWQKINSPVSESLGFRAVWTDGQEVFMLAEGSTVSYVLHGH